MNRPGQPLFPNSSLPPFVQRHMGGSAGNMHLQQEKELDLVRAPADYGEGNRTRDPTVRLLLQLAERILHVTCAGPAPFRNSSGLPIQQNPQARSSQMGAGRLTNGKLGSGSNWNFNMPTGAPGLTNMRSGNAGANSAMASFGQSMSGSQSAAALDLSDFPSLSGTPQAQHQNPGQAIWAQRPAQQSQAQRQQQEAQDSSQQGLRQSQQQQQQSSNDDSFPSGNQFTSNLDDFRPRGQGSSDQPQTGSIDEFPPLGRDSSIPMGNRDSSLEMGSERRGSLMQNTGFGAYTNVMAFAGMGPQRNPLANPNLINRSQEQSRITSPATQGMGSLSSSRSPLPQGQNGTIGQDKPGAIGSAAHRGSTSAAMENQRNARQYNYGSQAFPSEGESSQIANQSGAFGNSEVVESPAASQEVQSIEHMSEADRFGLAGLMAKLHDPVQRHWVIGQDLSALDTNRNPSEPMYQSWTTPFTPNAPPSRPLETDYTLPDCYNVANVTPLRERISGFTEETLFYIFYSMPRDLMQVLVAEELIGRRWRYHKGEKMWLTRDESHELPREVEPGISEVGYYLWWDEKQWKKVRKQHLLRYEDLENEGDTGVVQNAAAISTIGMTRATGGGLAGGMGSGNGFGALAAGGVGGLMGLGRGL